MNIKKQVAYILEHPYTKEAIAKAQAGDTEMLAHLLSEVHIHSYLTVGSNALRTYRLNKKSGSFVIIDELRCMPPPDNLNIKLPFIEKATPVLEVAFNNTDNYEAAITAATVSVAK